MMNNSIMRPDPPASFFTEHEGRKVEEETRMKRLQNATSFTGVGADNSDSLTPGAENASTLNQDDIGAIRFNDENDMFGPDYKDQVQNSEQRKVAAAHRATSPTQQPPPLPIQQQDLSLTEEEQVIPHAYVIEDKDVLCPNLSRRKLILAIAVAFVLLVSISVAATACTVRKCGASAPTDRSIIQNNNTIATVSSPSTMIPTLNNTQQPTMNQLSSENPTTAPTPVESFDSTKTYTISLAVDNNYGQVGWVLSVEPDSMNNTFQPYDFRDDRSWYVFIERYQAEANTEWHLEAAGNDFYRIWLANDTGLLGREGSGLSATPYEGLPDDRDPESLYCFIHSEDTKFPWKIQKNSKGYYTITYELGDTIGWGLTAHRYEPIPRDLRTNYSTYVIIHQALPLGEWNIDIAE